MKKIVVVLAVLLSLALAQVGQAADLQADWYANIQGVHIYGYDYYGQPYLMTNAYFSSSQLGNNAPFFVSDGPSHTNYTRYISLPSDVFGVGPEQSLVLPMSFGISTGQQIAYLELAWATNYDSNSMYLQLWRQTYSGSDTLVWEQKLSGVQGNGEYIANDIVFEGPFYFKLNIVPEPSSIMCLGVALGCLLGAIRRRRA